LHRVVALKVVRRDLAADPMVRARFLREARAAAAVESDHIVPIFEADEASDGTLYMAMPFLQGETLRARLDGPRAPSIAEAVRIAREIAMGLAAAHARGLIHRDIKPANIWLERRDSDSSEGPGRVKLLDFGLARVAGTTDLTVPGTITGTPSYMSPEQARGEELDARSDLFSLGTVLYRLVTGRLPFGGERATAILRAIEEHEPPPPRTLRPELPAELDRLIGELLSKRPEDRPASAKEVEARLRSLRQP
jgi:eukaryotic-like serine/threonine-protein kinase